MLENRPYILITGASSGVGRATAILLSDQYNLIIHGRNLEKLEATKSMCSSSSEVKLWQCNFMAIDKIEESFKKVIADIQVKISGYVHSSGVVEVLPLRAISLERIMNILNTNFISASILSRLLIQKKVNGTELRNIIYISSNISNRGAKGFSAYGASKGALDSFMRCLAIELAPRVRVNSILPGGMHTEMTAQMSLDQDLMDRMEATYPLGMCKTEDIAGVVRFLLSDYAKWITGQQITVDGGRTVDITG